MELANGEVEPSDGLAPTLDMSTLLGLDVRTQAASLYGGIVSTLTP